MIRWALLRFLIHSDGLDGAADSFIASCFS